MDFLALAQERYSLRRMSDKKVSDVEASHEKGIVKFNYTNEEDIKAAIEAIEDLGFIVNE